MEKLLKGIFFTPILLFIIGISACSGFTSNNENKTTEPKDDSINKTLSMPISGNTCKRPDEIQITNTIYQSAGNYTLTYSWSKVNNATTYKFELLLNGASAFQNLALTDTFITFPITIAALDKVSASVKTICGPEQSPTSKASSTFLYQNAIATDVVIFLASSSSSVSDICSTNCQNIKFLNNTIKNSDGSTITLEEPDMQVYYYDFNVVKECIQCDESGNAPLVDPIAFNNCLKNPLNEYWVYDPGKYKVCK